MTVPNASDFTPEEVIALVLEEEHLYGEARRVAGLVARRLAVVLACASSKTTPAMIRERGGALEWVGVGRPVAEPTQAGKGGAA